MKKNGEFVGVDEKFIPENEKYVDESLLGNNEKNKKIFKKVGIGYLLFMCVPIIIFVCMAIFMGSRFKNFSTNISNKYTFSNLQGTQSGFKLRTYLDEIITNNKLESYTKITVVYNGKSATTEDELLSLKNELPNTSTEAYEVSLDYADSRGQAVNKVTIKDI